MAQERRARGKNAMNLVERMFTLGAIIGLAIGLAILVLIYPFDCTRPMATAVVDEPVPMVPIEPGSVSRNGDTKIDQTTYPDLFEALKADETP